MNRTKEALIQQHEIKKRKARRYRFSFTSSSQASTAFIYVGIAALFFVLPFVLPDVAKNIWKTRLTTAVLNQELSNEVYSGQFRLSPYIGDTRPHSDATFWGIYIIKSAGLKLRNEARAQDYIQKPDQRFNNNTKDIYQGIVILKSLGQLSLDDPNSKKHVDSLYSALLALNEQYSGFRPGVDFSSTVEATYYAFEAIQELGRFDTFRQRPEFDSAIGFVASMKDPNTKGFRNTAGNNATLLSTWHATQVLARKSPKDSELVAGAFAGVERFVISAQARDGGFLDRPIENAAEGYTARSTSASTSQALYILSTLKKLGLISFGLTDVTGAVYFDGISYLRATLSWKYGIVRSYPGQGTDLEAAYNFVRLVDAYPSISYGIPRALEFSLLGCGILLLVAAVITYVRPQLTKVAISELLRVVKVSAGFLFVGAVVLSVAPNFAVVVYLAYAVYLVIQYYEVSLTDNTDGLMVLTAAGHNIAFFAVYFFFITVAPATFANLKVFYLLGLIEIIGFFGITLVACYNDAANRLSFYVSAAFLGWIGNTVLFYSFLYGRGDMDVVYRLLVIHGHFPLVFVVLPLVTLVAAFGLSAYAAYAFFERKDREEVGDRKERKQKKKKEKAENKEKTEKKADDNASAEGNVD